MQQIGEPCSCFLGRDRALQQRLKHGRAVQALHHQGGSRRRAASAGRRVPEAGHRIPVFREVGHHRGFGGDVAAVAVSAKDPVIIDG
ncbi:hypothetical protein ABK046_41370 [Streptomyces caeruleatus]